jgi:tRNA uridine 5-carboxymethylaminomethyl modification enzyme
LGNLTGQTYAQILKRPEVPIEALYPLLRDEFRSSEDCDLFAPWITDAGLAAHTRNELKSAETEIKYSGYLDQQKKSIEKLKKAEGRIIPDWFDYGAVSGLSREMKEKLTRIRPSTIGQASRIPGVTPAALSLINVFIEIQAKRAEGLPA